MPLRPCIACGSLTTTTRCRTCETRRQQIRNANPRRRTRYNADHRQLRRQWAPHVATGTIACARCGQLILGDFDLDHLPDGSRPSHPSCNRAAH